MKEQEQIKYRDIMSLGFEEIQADDTVYLDQYGYDYVIIQKNLTKKIHLKWHKETRLCELVRTDGKGNIRARRTVSGLNMVKQIINFFTDNSF